MRQPIKKYHRVSRDTKRVRKSSASATFYSLYEEGVGVDGGIHPMIGGTDGAARGELSSLITYGTDFGTRDMGQKLREKLLPLINGQEKVVLDFTGVNVVSNSFADECIAKLLLEMPLAELKRRTTFRGLNPLAERSILVALQRFPPLVPRTPLPALSSAIIWGSAPHPGVNSVV